MKRIKVYLCLLRVKHYIKNLLIFIPVFFAGEIFQTKTLKVLMGYIAFCFTASIIYIVNDIKDVNKDKLHPTKKYRPIASGEISMQGAYIVAMVLTILTALIVIVGKMGIGTILLLGLYLIINLAYSYGLKSIPVLDVVILASGFLIRICYGGAAADITISAWLYLTVIAFAFYMGLGKRRNELRRMKNAETRSVMKYYSDDYLNQNMYMCMTIGLVFYSLWAMDRSSRLFVTVPFCMVICMLYNLILEKDCEGDPVTTLLSNKWLIVLVVIYVFIMCGCIYG